MNVFLSSPEELRRTCYDMVRVFYPDAIFTKALAGADFAISITPTLTGDQVSVVASQYQVRTNQADTVISNFTATDHCFQGEVFHNAQKRVAKLAIKGLLEASTGREVGPWGILTGIRPTKIVHRVLDLGWSAAQVASFLQTHYALSPAKSQLLLEITQLQRPFLHAPQEAAKLVSIYLGIPFCPTRCVYCSFPATSLQRHRHWVEPFVAALLLEIQAIGEALRQQGLQVETIYIGGGTPTSLPVAKLDQILQAVDSCLRTAETREYTVEAGRPDTLSLEMLQLLKDHRITRLSINPQSMNAQTLQAIGRAHSPQEVVQAVENARRLGFDNINMDLIVGLPGEGLAEVQHTLQQLQPLQPENLTVHTLALKRAATLTAKLKGYPTVKQLAGSGELKDIADGTEVNSFADSAEVSAMLALTYQQARSAGLRPYYLYRQKQMLGSLENVGFAKPGFEGIYNIQMMEERQTIIGLGGGSASKWVNCQDWSLESSYNPKDPQYYFQRISELIQKKQERIQALEPGQ